MMGKPGSVLHRLWECRDPGVIEARSRVVDEGVVERALVAGATICLLTKAWVVFKEELYAQPAADPTACVLPRMAHMAPPSNMRLPRSMSNAVKWATPYSPMGLARRHACQSLHAPHGPL